MFENVYGHAFQKETLISAIENDRISHAYLFSGKSGIGKKMIALEFARNILNTEDLKTCVDFKYVEKLEDKKEILVEQIRENISDDVIERPITGTKKVYVIDDANLLNISAQNALLKTIEEPPEYVVIILIASNTSTLLPTILSRVLRVDFNPLDYESVESYIEKNGIKIDKNIIGFASGSIGVINEIISNNLVDKLKKVDEILEYMEKKDISSSLLKVQEVDFNESFMLSYLQYLLFERKYFEASLEPERAINRLKMNGNYDIVIDNMIIRCIERM